MEIVGDGVTVDTVGDVVVLVRFKNVAYRRCAKRWECMLLKS